MEKSTDTFLTLKTPGKEVLYKDRKSKFYGYAFPISSAEEVKPIIEHLKKLHPTANHVCYAWQTGIETIQYRANDDGEPNNSAGAPIYGQIQAFKVTNVLIAVARIFGGTKLGVGGLISAYREAAKMALNESLIIEKLVEKQFTVTFSYDQMNKIMRIIKQHELVITSQNLELTCSIVIAVRKSKAEKIFSIFNALNNVKIQ